jgi:hypothetical protein
MHNATATLLPLLMLHCSVSVCWYSVPLTSSSAQRHSEHPFQHCIGQISRPNRLFASYNSSSATLCCCAQSRYTHACTAAATASTSSSNWRACSTGASCTVLQRSWSFLQGSACREGGIVRQCQFYNVVQRDRCCLGVCCSAAASA